MIYGVSAPLVLAVAETRPSAAHDLAHKLSLKRRPSTEANENSATTETLQSFFQEALILPTKLLFTEPVVFFFTLLSALSYGLVFVSSQSVTQVYTTLFSWPEWKTGTVQAAIAVGEIVGFLVCLLQNHLFAQQVAKDVGVPALDSKSPEARLYLSVPGGFIGLTGGLFWYGWTAYPQLNWILPAIGLFLVGIGSMVVMQAIMVYITDSYNEYAGSASAAVCFGENVFAAFLPLSAASMYTNLGFQWASSLLAFLAFTLSFAPLSLFFAGRSVRRRSPFMRRGLSGTVITI